MTVALGGATGRVALGMFLLASLPSCEVIIGTLNDCTVDSDCASGGPSLMCQNKLCVADTRCSVLGQAGPGSVTFGMIIDLTDQVGDGGYIVDSNGPHWRDVVELVVTQLNPPIQQGIDGHPIEVVLCDSQGSPTESASLAQRMVSDGVQALLSGDSSETIGNAAVTVPAHALMISGYSTSPEVTTLDATADGVRLVWRTVESDAFLVKVLIQQIESEAADAGAPLPRVAVFARNDAYGQGFNGVFQPNYPGPQDSFFFDPSGDQDVAGLTAANSYQPALSVMALFPQDIDRLLNEIESTNSYPNLQAGPWYFCDQMLVPGTINGVTNPQKVYGGLVVAAAPFDPSSPAYAWLKSNFTEAYGADPSQYPNLASYADAMMLLAIAAGTNTAQGKPLTGVNLASVLGQVSSPTASADAGTLLALDPTQYSHAVLDLANGTPISVQGASGPLHFDPVTGEAPSYSFVYQIESDNTFKIITTYPPSQ